MRGPAQVRGQGCGGPGVRAERGAVLEMRGPRGAGPGLGVRVWGRGRRCGSGKRSGGVEVGSIGESRGSDLGGSVQGVPGCGVRPGSCGPTLGPSANKADCPRPPLSRRPRALQPAQEWRRGPPEPGVGLSADPRPGWRPWATERPDHTLGTVGVRWALESAAPRSPQRCVQKALRSRGRSDPVPGAAPARLGHPQDSPVLRVSWSSASLPSSSHGVFRVYAARPQETVRGWGGRTRETKASVLKVQ